jgi:nucleoside-diphosphate-sugar epimerase
MNIKDYETLQYLAEARSGGTPLESEEDLKWLHDVHGVDVTGVKIAILYGNEDWPDKVETYAENDYRATPTVWVTPEGGGKMVRK